MLDGWVRTRQGQATAGLAQMAEGLAAYRATGAEVGVAHFLVALAEAHGDAGDTEGGLRLTEDALALSRRNGNRYFEPEAWRVRGQILWQVELPLAVPYLAAGFRTTSVQVVATATLAAFVNGGGLGMIISRGFGLGMHAGGGQLLAGGLLVALLCLIVEGLLALGQRLVTPAPLRKRSVVTNT